MKVRNHLAPPTFLTVVFVVSLFLLFFIAGLSFRQISNLTETQEAIKRSLEIRINLETMFSELKDAEGAHRGYLLTKDERYLLPYNYSQVRINKSMLAIRDLIEADKQRQHEFDILRNLINKRFRELRDNISESRLIDTSAPNFKARLWDGKGSMDDIRTQINKIVESEKKILDRQELEHDDEITFTPITSVVLVIFSLIVFLFTFRRINLNLRQVGKLNHRLQLINETFNYAEKIGEICHWQYDLATQELTFSDNKFNLLGFTPQSFKPTVDSFIAMVHPQDRKKVRNAFLKELTTDTFSIYFRIIRKDKRVRYFKSISKLTRDSEGKEIIIGVDCDVTIQHRSTMKLEQKNLELKSSNAELSSFNHIVSHDLQEPLRKIQMFISRIDETDVAKLSETSSGYFERIRSSSERAQKLIDDLLVYSRLNRTDKKPEPANLNDLLQNAKTDLAQVIEEKNAVIISDELPTIKVIPHQIEQLFLNLISNSLKYAKTDVTPEIKVSYQTVLSRRTPELRKRIHKKYHLFTFSDNGIGFDQHYSEKIFVLFHRLHDRENYSGTGIGLAICKKMVENHHGLIFGYSKPGEGATFKVFLPA
ncbi:MAG TPA: CHASE3 domain-containing protein [Flavobacterium sp.]|jgi:hypothetical protein